MKRSQVLAVSVLTLLLLAAIPVQQSRASGSYSESLKIFIAGSNAYWYFTFTGINGSSKLAQFEGSPGMSWYNVTAIKTTNWDSDFQIFGPEGYNLTQVPFIPSQGLFLTIGSDSYSDALAAAGRLDAYLLSTFVSLSNGTSSFEFYSPVSFTTIIPSTLLVFVPTSMGGFAAAIHSGFTSTLSPFVVLEGTKSSSGFSHNLVVGSISNKSLDTQNRPNFLTYFGTTISSLKAANQSSSSTIQVRALDGIVRSTDNAAVVNDNFTGSYALTLAPMKKVSRINATVLQQPLQLLAARYIDVGVLQKNQNMSVTISLTNLSNSTALTNVTFTDNWWNPSLFRLIKGNSTFTALTLSGGAHVAPFYVLQYIGNMTGRVTIPAEPVRFAYAVGGSTFKGRTWLNSITISLGEDDPVIYAYVAPHGGVNEPVGSNMSLSLVVKNVGTWPALSVIVDNLPQTGAILPGDTTTVKISPTADGLLGTNVTQKYVVTYEDKNGNSFSATTNLLPLEFTHSSMQLGFALVSFGATLSPHKTGSAAINLTLSFTVSNIGSAIIRHFKGQVQVPTGLGCGVTKGAGISCNPTSHLLSLNYTSLTFQTTEETNMTVVVINPANYFIPPLSFQGTTQGINFTGKSNAFAVPTGYVLTKQFSPSLLFSGTSSTVTLSAVNKGPFYIYNATVSSGVDTFDRLSQSALPSVTNGSIIPGGSLSRSYNVTASAVYGNHTSTPIASSIFFGGTKFNLEGLGPYVSVYQPLNVTVKTTPTVPTEGKDFNFVLTIHNPTAVNVSSILFTLPVPSGLTLSHLNNSTFSNGVLTISTPLLLLHSSYDATGVAVASSSATVSFEKASLTFVYEGVTVKGATPQQGISIAANVTTRYLIPIAIAIVALFATAFYVRRMAGSTVPASPK